MHLVAAIGEHPNLQGKKKFIIRLLAYFVNLKKNIEHLMPYMGGD